MKPAQIGLTNYFVNALSFTANRNYDSSRPSLPNISDYEIVPRSEVLDESRRSWRVELRVGLPELADKNFPCSFRIDLVGNVKVDESLSEEYIDRFVNINGAALVFGVAREIVRALTASGPGRAVLLPSVTFWEPKAPSPSAAATATPSIVAPEPSTASTP